MTALERALELNAPAAAILQRYGTHHRRAGYSTIEAKLSGLRIVRNSYSSGNPMITLEIWSGGEKVMGLAWGRNGEVYLLGFDDRTMMYEGHAADWIGQVRQYGAQAN
jgi:hypothetical protein